jgi:hypothetical protein
MSGSAAPNDGYAGHLDPSDHLNDHNATVAIINKMMARRNISIPVRVVAVTKNGEMGPPGFLSVTPLVNQVDGAGNAVEHAVVHNIPYIRHQCGGSAIIMDPKVGDIGTMVIADRDISGVKETRDRSNPGSWRSGSMADGIYMGTVLGNTPTTNTVRFHDGGVEIASMLHVTITSPHVTITSDDVQINGTSLKHNGHEVGSTHKHTGVSTGSGQTGAPV